VGGGGGGVGGGGDEGGGVGGGCGGKIGGNSPCFHGKGEVTLKKKGSSDRGWKFSSRKEEGDPTIQGKKEKKDQNKTDIKRGNRARKKCCTKEKKRERGTVPEITVYQEGWKSSARLEGVDQKENGTKQAVAVRGGGVAWSVGKAVLPPRRRGIEVKERRAISKRGRKGGGKARTLLRTGRTKIFRMKVVFLPGSAKHRVYRN